MTKDNKTAIIWLKRDLRIRDHAPLRQAISDGRPIILWYCYEPALIDDIHYADRHFQFINDSLEDLNQQLSVCDTQLLITQGDPVSILEHIHEIMGDIDVHSYEETGIKVTYDRDKQMRRMCDARGINWTEYQSNGITRGRRNRDEWLQDWYRLMSTPIPSIRLGSDTFVNMRIVKQLHQELNQPVTHQFAHNPLFQQGGELVAHDVLLSFVRDRIKGYAAGISKPSLSRNSCSRISPYLAWGNLSVRQAWQAGYMHKEESTDKRQYAAFMSRLRWHDHFIQKFEMECSMEFISYNRAYAALHKPVNEDYIKAWEEGRTGYPMVDACMRCLNATGYINFRMRAMMVSFLTHHLWQPWQRASPHLARQFLDFEPGIHYPQLQMQAGTTGANTLRIYNPVKQSQDHDPHGDFIKEWIPELNDVPSVHIHEPWLMTPMEQIFCGVIIGDKYPAPIVDLKTAARHAREVLYEYRKRPEVRREAKRIVAKHTIGGESRPNQ